MLSTKIFYKKICKKTIRKQIEEEHAVVEAFQRKRRRSSNSASLPFQKIEKGLPKKGKAAKRLSRQDFFTKLVDLALRWDEKEEQTRRQTFSSHLSPQQR